MIDKKAKYCDDADCANFGKPEWGDCSIGLDVKFRVPNGYDDIQRDNWGYVRPAECKKLMRLKAKQK